jgi:membrane protease YdiL (CAAX protease family)
MVIQFDVIFNRDGFTIMDNTQLAKAFEGLAEQVTIVDVVVCGAGILVLLVWLLKTTFGTKALQYAPTRRNNMPPYLAIIPLFMWFGTVSLLVSIKKIALPGLPDWQDALADNLILCLGVAPAIAISMIMAWSFFARRLKGFGLNPKTILRDLGAALLNLLAIMPVILGVIVLTTFIGELIVGPDFQMPRHEELKQIMEYSQWQVRALIIVTAIVIVPFAEEMLFRGMVQTALRSLIARPWPAVIITSLIFVVFHENPEHWPALFALSLCLGYSYEKSGSLFRPIFIHSLFNAMSVLAALSQ